MDSCWNRSFCWGEQGSENLSIGTRLDVSRNDRRLQFRHSEFINDWFCELSNHHLPPFSCSLLALDEWQVFFTVLTPQFALFFRPDMGWRNHLIFRWPEFLLEDGDVRRKSDFAPHKCFEVLNRHLRKGKEFYFILRFVFGVFESRERVISASIQGGKQPPLLSIYRSAACGVQVERWDTNVQSHQLTVMCRTVWSYLSGESTSESDGWS